MKNYVNRKEDRAVITFVIPAYNAELTLERTLNSVLRQSDDRYRILLIDDGSVDGTAQIGKEYAEKYPQKIRYFFQENRGLGGARNTGLKLVETEYVSFLDSDDWLMADYVERILGQIEAAEKKPEIVMTLPTIWHEQSRAVQDWYDRELFLKIFPEDGRMVEPEKELRLYQFEVNVCRKVLQMEFVRRTHFSFREKVKWEDVYPHFYLLSQCRRCMGVAVGFYYRIGSETQITACTGNDRMDIVPVFGDVVSYIERRHEELIFPAMRVILRFSFWCIRMADVGTRKPLVKRLHSFYKKLPGRYFRILRRESRRWLPRKDAVQYALLSAALRWKPLSLLFYDYLWQEICEKLVKKVLKAKDRTA